MKAWSLVLSKEVSVTKEGDHYVDQDGNLWHDFELACLQEDINWQKVRIDAAIKLARALSEKMLGTGYSEKQIAKQVVELADALVTELQKKGGEEND